MAPSDRPPSDRTPPPARPGGDAADEIDLADLFGPDPDGPPAFGRPSRDPADDSDDVLRADGGDPFAADGGSDVLRGAVLPSAGNSNIFDAPPVGSSRFHHPTDATDVDAAFLPHAAASSWGGEDGPPSDVFTAPRTVSEADLDLSSRAANDLLAELDTPFPASGSGGRADDGATDADFRLRDSGVDLLHPDTDPDQAAFAGPGSSIFAGNLPPDDSFSRVEAAPPPGRRDRAGQFTGDDPAGADDDGTDDIFLGAPPAAARPAPPGRRPAPSSHESGTIDWSSAAPAAGQVPPPPALDESDEVDIPDLHALSGSGEAYPESLVTGDPSGVTPAPAPPRRAAAAPTPARRGSAGWAVPAAGGLAAGAVLSAAAFLTVLAPPPPAPAAPLVTQVPAPAPAAAGATLADARALLAAGEPAWALTTLEAAGPDPAPPVRLDRGKARWQVRVRELAAAGTPPAADDPMLADAAADFTAVVAAAAGTTDPADLQAGAAAAVQLGLTREVVGDPAGAAAAYADGAAKFPAAKPLFDTALLRLKATAPAKPLSLAPRPALDLAQAAAMAVTLLAPPGDAPAADAPLPPEAGFQFWVAVNAAAGGDYAAARAAVREAKAAHDGRRLRLAGRGLNPQSDPLEQIFTRCCDDLAEFYALKEATYTHPAAGPLVAKHGVTAGLDKLAAGKEDPAAVARLAGLAAQVADRDESLTQVRGQLKLALAAAENAATDGKRAAIALAQAVSKLTAERATAAAAQEAAATAQTGRQKADAAVAALTAEVKTLKARPAMAPPADAADAVKRLAQAESAADAARTAQKEAEAKAAAATEQATAAVDKRAAAEAAAEKAAAAEKSAETALVAAEKTARQAAADLATRLAAEKQAGDDRAAAATADGAKLVAAAKAEAADLLARQRAEFDAERRTLTAAKLAAEKQAADARQRAAALAVGQPAPATPSGGDAAAGQARYTTGIDAYFAGRYADAERALADAVNLDGASDARPWYFLGLAQLQLGQDAAAAFGRGADLERRGLPGRRDVAAALERVQGTARRVLTNYRP